jgi:hypothetical protein
MRKALLLGGVVLLFAALTACSDGLSTGDDNPLSDRDSDVHGTVYLVNTPHTASVGLRHVYTDPYSTYLMQTTAGQSGYYSFDITGLDYGWYACDAWYNAFRGSSSDFEWQGSGSFTRDIHMY